MAIIIKIDVMLAKRKMSVTELSEKVGITMANLSILKNEKAKAIRLSTLDAFVELQIVSPETFWNTQNNHLLQRPTSELTGRPISPNLRPPRLMRTSLPCRCDPRIVRQRARRNAKL